MTLTVLTDENVRRVLHLLDKKDIEDLQQTLADALHQYSMAGEEDGRCSSYQPHRTSLKRADGKTTLFMPASSNNGLGVKIITLDTPEEPTVPLNLKRLSLSSTASSDAKSSRANSISTSSSLEKISRPSTATSIITTPRGSVTLFDAVGNPSAMINCEELTAFRTALASTMLMKKRKSVHDITVFGAGKQAYWHVRLAMLLRGTDIHHLNVVNRSFDRARQLLMSIYNPFPNDPEFDNLIGHKYNTKTKTSILTPGHGEYGRLMKKYVRDANVIFCCTPSTQPLFPASYLLNPGGRQKARYIALIGSYKPHMLELHPDVLRSAVAPHHEHRHYHKHQKEGGAVIVDSVEACLQEAGEVIQAGLQPDQVVELGELVMLRKEAAKQAKEMGQGSEGDEGGIQVDNSSGLKEWLFQGNVIYKSVGLGLMDVVIGAELVRLAKELDIGTFVENF
ncbi:hypothetical protein AAFC00_004847 [Neodothiora populina]|uniref:NAD(P)-binding protein n=1 Tax=Neodothiora populina TaxID=2781224 RepID=A0ABR3P471_9PEZI